MQRWVDKIKDRSSENLTEAEEIMKRWQEYIEELYIKGLNSSNAVIVYYLLLFFFPVYATHGILFPQPGMEPMPHPVKGRSISH